MEVTLLGTGDTTGTPTVNCDCATCEAARERGFERTRFSVHVHNERTGETLLVDASPDFRTQFLREDDLDLPDAAVVTHIHFDHLHGLGNVFRLLGELPVYAGAETDPETGESVAETVAREYDYLDALDVRPVAPFEPVEAAGFEVTLVPADHPPLLCYGLRIEDPTTGASLAITGDTTWAIPEDARERLRGADLLLVDGIVNEAFCDRHPLGGDHEAPDGTRRTFGTKHMTIAGARRMADRLEAEEYRVIHVSHFTEAEDAFARDLAVDGERFAI